jgi:DNA-binding PucR family transcriptional regulator
LLVYLDTQHSVRATAEALHVHQNTIRYRLAALRDQLGIDLDDPTGRLWLWLRLSSTVEREPGFRRTAMVAG